MEKKSKEILEVVVSETRVGIIFFIKKLEKFWKKSTIEGESPVKF